jgi:hypothetical protein
MTPDKIDRLIARRAKLTSRRSINQPAVDEIDAQLATVTPGERNDVDLLLGRLCAILPERAMVKWSTDEQRAEWQAHGVEESARLAQQKQAEFDAWLDASMRRLCIDTEPSDAPSHDGMWM